MATVASGRTMKTTKSRLSRVRRSFFDKLTARDPQDPRVRVRAVRSLFDKLGLTAWNSKRARPVASLSPSSILSPLRSMQWIYSFDEGSKDMIALLGGKGANLAEMTKLGLPVPPGFTITTETCNYYLAHNEYPKDFQKQFDAALASLEKKIGKKLGDAASPLLVSVRSGAKISMPGMMDTVLNLGLNDVTIEGLLAQTKNPRFCWDSYRRFVNMFSDVVLGIPHEEFESAMDALKQKKGVILDTELTAEDLQKLTTVYKEIVRAKTGKPFPDDPKEQLKLAVEAVFSSWNCNRAVTYRKIHEIPHNLGTAVSIQSMVFGNMGENSGTGVAFTRNPSTGENVFYGEFLLNAQGEDVVAGIRTPEKIDQLEAVMPDVYKQLVGVRSTLEKHYRDMQDIEFTVEHGRLFMLQTRNGKRTAQAALRIAVEMVTEKLIDKKTAIMRVQPNQLNQLLHPSLDPKASKKVIAKGLPASPGAAVGKVVFSADDAFEWSQNGETVILVRKETTPEDIHGMHVSKGILTSMGGMTSHAAVVARGMGKCCVAGCADIIVNAKEKKFFTKSGVEVKEGEIITLDGSMGQVIQGAVPMVEPEMTPEFKILMGWADEVRALKVRTNADTPFDAQVARDFGAEGIGLCRTEHMFFDEDRIPKVREMIVAKDEKTRRAALEKLLPLQQKDFYEIFKVMSGLPVTVRLLDPPLHEFLPHTDAQIKEVAGAMGITTDELQKIVSSLHEINPMLGHRGCRLGITFPEIVEMQARAIFQAGIQATKDGYKVIAEIEVPIVSDVSELTTVKKEIMKIADELQNDITFHWTIGTMIELPRACLTADEIAKEADFFSFGTNDLTQTTYGISRDDGGKFLNYYLEHGLFETDPTDSIDRKGVGKLMKMAVELGRSVKENLDIGICGEHGGEPKSVMFCHEIGLNYVSCSPFRVPVARLAAAQAVILGL